ncbi:chemotaxis protein CheB [Lachnospiraceae bacterium 54-53]
MTEKSMEEAWMQAKSIGYTEKNLIIGLGASAGGLEALQQLFDNLPYQTGMSFVIVQHLSPDYKSLMAEILSKNTKMTVLQAENEMEVQPDHVYLIPPKKNMVISQRKLYLSDAKHEGINHPIDIFFTSLAEDMKKQAVAVVLSGTGSDGTGGVKAVKEHDGLVLVQNPDSARFDGMIKSAINTGLADFVLTPQEIAAEILNISDHLSAVQPDKTSPVFPDDDLMQHIYTVLKKACGIDFTHYKRSTVIRRIERRMVVTHSKNQSDYLKLLETGKDEARLLEKEILIGVTSFFRDPSYFEKLKHEAIYEILSRADQTATIRVWIAGCSTGEEAYTIAILFAEAMEELNLKREIKIFATDVDTHAIEAAGKGIFSENIINAVSSGQLTKYFVKQNDQYSVRKEIRRMVIFAVHNIFQDPPFGRLDLISCRNVMIYFQPVLQRDLFRIFHSSLKDGGYLFLGKSETAGDFSDVFKPVCQLEKIYIHTAAGRLPELPQLNYTVPVLPPPLPSENFKEEKHDINLEKIYLQFMEDFLPASVIVDEKNEVIHFFGGYSEFLRIGQGKASFNIFNLVNENLSLVISTGLNKCRNEMTDLTYTDVLINGTLQPHKLDLILKPVYDRRGSHTGLIAIVFNERTEIAPVGTVERFDINKTAAQRIVDLERELKISQDHLKATISEVETVNEELQAANEELLTANEELQSSNEELQSVNEELYTVNAEYQNKLAELTEMTNDLSNFLSSTMIGILFVDNNLNIRKFTDYIGREFQLMAQDVGRPLQIIEHCFQNDEITKDALNVQKSLAPLEREVTANGRYYTQRIAPYRTTDNSIKGLVITIIDSLPALK